MGFSILIVDDEPDVAELFRQRFRRETRQGTYVLHYATSGAEALDFSACSAKRRTNGKMRLAQSDRVLRLGLLLLGGANLTIPFR